MAFRVGVLVGSLRKDSYNGKLARAVVALAPKQLQFTEPLTLPTTLFNQDLEPTPPADWTAFRKKSPARATRCSS